MDPVLIYVLYLIVLLFSKMSGIFCIKIMIFIFTKKIFNTKAYRKAFYSEQCSYCAVGMYIMLQKHKVTLGCCCQSPSVGTIAYSFVRLLSLAWPPVSKCT